MATKQPQDRKPKQTVEPHDPSEKFVYVSRDGQHEFHLPYLENLTRRQIKQVQAASEKGEDVDDLLLKIVLSDEEYENLDDLTLLDQKQMAEQWNAESAISLGE